MKPLVIFNLMCLLFLGITIGGTFISRATDEQYDGNKSLITATYDANTKETRDFLFECKDTKQGCTMWELLADKEELDKALAARELQIDDCKAMKVMTKECQDLINAYEGKYQK